MPPKRAQRSRSRQTTPQSPPKQSASSRSPQRLRRGTRSRSHELAQPVQNQQKQHERALPAVDEESTSADEIEVVQPNAPSEVNANGSVTDDRESSDNDIDGTSSNGTTQLDALDVDLIVDNLSVLHQAAQQTLSLFDSQTLYELFKELRTPVSKVSKRLQNFVRNFNGIREVYGGGSYIDTSLILRKLTEGASLNEGPWRPDAIFQLANLSLFLSSLLQNDETAIYDTLERMFNSFPEPFVHFHIMIGKTRYGTQHVDQIVSFGISLRTQFFLRVAENTRRDPAFDPDAILLKVFFDDAGNLNGFQVDGDEILPGAEDAIRDRVQTIRESFRTSSEDPIDLPQLRKRFPWQRFLAKACKWVFLRKQELDDQIIAQGGIKAIQERLEKNDLSAYEVHTPYMQATPDLGQNNIEDERTRGWNSPKAIPPKLQSSRLSGSSAIARRTTRLKEIKAADELSSASSESSDEPVEKPSLPLQRTPLKSPANKLRTAATEIPQTPQGAVIEETEDNIINSDGERDEQQPRSSWPVRSSPPRPTQSSIIPTQQTLAVLEVAKEQAALGNKENIDTSKRSYMDKQTNAKRLEWDETQVTQKRMRNEVEEDENEEGEFETDTRPIKRMRMPQSVSTHTPDEWVADDSDDVAFEPRRPQNGIGSSTQSTPRQQLPSSRPLPQRSPLQHRGQNLANAITSSAVESPKQSANNQPNLQRHQTISTTHSPTATPASTQAESHRTVNAQAKATMRLRPLLDPAATAATRVQVRRPWTLDETNRLFDMIALHGCSWSQIMTEDLEHPDGPALQMRSQVQLKDKARNLKMDYLKAGSELPDGFDGVTIKSSDKELLRGLGMPFE